MTIRELHTMLTGFIENGRGGDTVQVASDPEGNEITELDAISSGPGTITLWP